MHQKVMLTWKLTPKLNSCILYYPLMGHPNKMAVRKHESIHENRSFVFVHVTAYSCKSVVRFTYFFFKSIFTWKSNQVYLQDLLQATKLFPHLQCLIYSVNLRIQSEYSKIRTRDNAVFGHFSRSGQYEKYAYLHAF